MRHPALAAIGRHAGHQKVEAVSIRPSRAVTCSASQRAYRSWMLHDFASRGLASAPSWPTGNQPSTPGGLRLAIDEDLQAARSEVGSAKSAARSNAMAGVSAASRSCVFAHSDLAADHKALGSPFSLAESLHFPAVLPRAGIVRPASRKTGSTGYA